MVHLADARRVIAAAEKKAAEIGQPMNVAVVDAREARGDRPASASPERGSGCDACLRSSVLEPSVRSASLPLLELR